MRLTDQRVRDVLEEPWAVLDDVPDDLLVELRSGKCSGHGDLRHFEDTFLAHEDLKDEETRADVSGWQMVVLEQIKVRSCDDIESG